CLRILLPEGGEVRPLLVFVLAAVLDDRRADQELADSVEPILVEVGLLANAVHIGPVRIVVVLGSDAPREQQAGDRAVPVAGVGGPFVLRIVWEEVGRRNRGLLLDEILDGAG